MWAGGWVWECLDVGSWKVLLGVGMLKCGRPGGRIGRGNG